MNWTYEDFVEDALKRVREVTVQDVMSGSGQADIVLLDCREPNEWNLGHLPNAVHLPRGLLERDVTKRVPTNKRVVIYCASGKRSVLAADTMQRMGYSDVASMAGGFRAWVDAGGEVDG